MVCEIPTLAHELVDVAVEATSPEAIAFSVGTQAAESLPGRGHEVRTQAHLEVAGWLAPDLDAMYT